MQFMLMMNTPAGTGDYKINDWSPEDFKAHIDFMHRFNKELRSPESGRTGRGSPRPARRSSFAPERTVRRSPMALPGDRRSSSLATGSWTSTRRSVPTSSRPRRRLRRVPEAQPMNMPIEVRRVASAAPQV